MTTSVRITAFIAKDLTDSVLSSLRSSGIEDVNLTPSRSLVLDRRKGLMSSLFASNGLGEDSANGISFLVEEGDRDHALALVIKAGGLNLPGRGSVFAEEVQVAARHESFAVNSVAAADASARPQLHVLTGISCIVQRGQGNAIGRVLLQAGGGVPYIVYGIGTGVRDKMGLLRIAIPAEKEVVHTIVDRHEAETLMELMIEAGHLDQPGKGFIYRYPVAKGLPNLQVSREEGGAMASMEQIISTIDKMEGNANWRRKSSAEKKSDSERRFLTGLVDMNLLCTEGYSQKPIAAAMKAGAAGATTCILKRVIPRSGEGPHAVHSREQCSMIVPEDRVAAITAALDEAGAFKDECKGMLVLRKSEKAFTYLGRKG